MDYSSENTPPPQEDISGGSTDRIAGTDGARYNPVERARAKHLCRQLQMRLQYARLKVEHGWVGQELEEVENLYFHQSKAGGSASPKSNPTNKRKRGSNPYPDPMGDSRPNSGLRLNGHNATTEVVTSSVRQHSPVDALPSPTRVTLPPARPPNKRALSFPRPSVSPAPFAHGYIAAEPSKRLVLVCPISEERSMDTRTEASSSREVSYPLYPAYGRPEAQIDPALQELSAQPRPEVSTFSLPSAESRSESSDYLRTTSGFSTSTAATNTTSSPPDHLTALSSPAVTPPDPSFQTFRIAKPVVASSTTAYAPVLELGHGLRKGIEHPPNGVLPQGYGSPVPSAELTPAENLAPAAQILPGSEDTDTVPIDPVLTTTPPLPDADGAPNTVEGESNGCHLVIPTFSYGDPNLTYDSFWTTHGMGKAMPGTI